MLVRDAPAASLWERLAGRRAASSNRLVPRDAAAVGGGGYAARSARFPRSFVVRPCDAGLDGVGGRGGGRVRARVGPGVARGVGARARSVHRAARVAGLVRRVRRTELRRPAGPAGARCAPGLGAGAVPPDDTASEAAGPPALR